MGRRQVVVNEHDMERIGTKAKGEGYPVVAAN